MGVFIRINLGADVLINRMRTERLRSKSARSALTGLLQAGAFRGLGPYKDLVRMHVEHQPAVGNLRAVILFMRRIWAENNSGRIMRVSSARWDKFLPSTDISCQPLAFVIAVAGVAPCSTRSCFILPMRESVPCA